MACFHAIVEQEHQLGQGPSPSTPRNRVIRKFYNHRRALFCIKCDYLDNVPLFDGKEFDTMFCISRSRFQRIMEDFAAMSNPFYKYRAVDNKGNSASFETKLLFPLKTIAYGVPSHTFRDYFQMSPSLARLFCRLFHCTTIDVYLSEYLRLPTAADVKNVFKLHEHKHNVKVMMGSLYCLHTTWKNCPVAWQGSFKGKQFSLKQRLTTTSGSGMQCMDFLALLMI